MQCLLVHSVLYKCMPKCEREWTKNCTIIQWLKWKISFGKLCLGPTVVAQRFLAPGCIDHFGAPPLSFPSSPLFPPIRCEGLKSGPLKPS